MTSKSVARVGDKTVGHDSYKPRATKAGSAGGNAKSVFANTKLVNTEGSEWAPHGSPPGDRHASDTDGSPDVTNPIPGATVFINGKAVACIGDKVEADTIAGGSPDVFIGDNSEFASFSAPDVAFVVEQTDVDQIDNSNSGSKISTSQSEINRGISSGVVSASSPLVTTPTTVGNIDSTQPPAGITSTPVKGDFNNYNQDNIPYDTLMLTDKTSLAMFTTKAALWGNQPTPKGPNAPYAGGGDNKYIRAQYGLTVPQILNNLANLAKNVYEPVKARYPRVIITNTFRQGPPGAGKPQAQHGLGMAMDLVFPGVPNSGYYDIACWIRDNLPFDQLLQEKCGSKIWIHVSHYSGNGTQVPKQNKIANVIVDQGKFIPGLAPLA